MILSFSFMACDVLLIKHQKQSSEVLIKVKSSRAIVRVNFGAVKFEWNMTLNYQLSLMRGCGLFQWERSLSANSKSMVILRSLFLSNVTLFECRGWGNSMTVHIVPLSIPFLFISNCIFFFCCCRRNFSSSLSSGQLLNISRISQERAAHSLALLSPSFVVRRVQNLSRHNKTENTKSTNNNPQNDRVKATALCMCCPVERWKEEDCGWSAE